MKSIFEERYSCRSYDPARPVSRDTLMEILEAVRLAPSACNRQPWTFVVAESAESRETVCRAYDREWIRTAPVMIIAFGHPASAWHRACDGKGHTDVDVAIAVEHLCLAATEAGLGTCWVCNFDPDMLRRAFPDMGEPIAVIPLGYAAEGSSVPAKVRKPMDEIVKWA